MGPWAFGVLEGRQVARWLASRAGWRADVLRDRTSSPRCEGTDQNSVEVELIKSPIRLLVDCCCRVDCGRPEDVVVARRNLMIRPKGRCAEGIRLSWILVRRRAEGVMKFTIQDAS